MATITLKGNPVHTVGSLPTVGTNAPNFTVTKLDLSDVSLSDFKNKKVILNIFPSLDTPTCALAMKHFNDLAAKHADVAVLCVSADLPFAQKRFCGAESLNNVMPVSTFRHPEFGQAYGVTIQDSPLKGLLSRAVVMIGADGKVIYTEQVKEIAEEPNYSELAKLL